MIYTGVDGNRIFSIDYSPLKKMWEKTDKQGRKVYVIPSDLCYVRKERTDIKSAHDLRKALSIEIEEKFGEVTWDVELKDNVYCLAVVRGFDLPEDRFALDPEVFSLARAARALGKENCYVLDIGKTKTTLVNVEGGELYSYRVVLKGTDYLREKVSEEVLVEEGLKNKTVRDALEIILSSLGRDLLGKPILLSGSGSHLKGIESFFERGFKNDLVSPELNSAFGAALKFVYSDCSPDFREEELSDKDLKKVSLILGSSIILFAASGLGMNHLKDSFVSKIREAERKEFNRKFPQKPAVAVRDQVKSMAAAERYPLTRRMFKLSEKLSTGMKIYRIEFEGGILRVVGEAKNRDAVIQMEAKKVRETPEGSFEFEVEIR